MINFIYSGTEIKSLTKVILEKYDRLSYSSLQKILRKKDIKINGKRVKENIDLKQGDCVEIYADDDLLNGDIKLDITYEDDNILIINKPNNIEVVSSEDDDAATDKINLEYFVNKYLAAKGQGARACHRLDRNTAGLVIFAKKEQSYNEVFDALKQRTIKKYYLAIVYGNFNVLLDTLNAYLTKDSISGKSYVTTGSQNGSEKIVTKYSVLSEKQGFSLLEIELVTGKTHQIRAHMAFIKHAVVGDPKYSPREKYQDCKFKSQILLAYKIQFNFTGMLSYLNDKTIEISTEKIYDIFKNL